MVAIKVKITDDKKDIFAFLGHVYRRSAERIANEAKEASQKDYMSKRKETKLPSLIFNSFVVSVPFATKLGARAVVIAGGPVAPYAVFVDEGHKFRDGSDFEGYKFMDAGLEHAEKVAEKIIIEELNKLGR